MLKASTAMGCGLEATCSAAVVARGLFATYVRAVYGAKSEILAANRHHAGRMPPRRDGAGLGAGTLRTDGSADGPASSRDSPLRPGRRLHPDSGANSAGERQDQLGPPSSDAARLGG